jgi:DNA-binding NtrC family response regulator
MTRPAAAPEDRVTPDVYGSSAILALAPRLQTPGGMQTPSSTLQAATLHEVKRAHVLAVLAACHGNRTLAAQTLQVNRKTLYRMLRRWESTGSMESSEPAELEAAMR